ncbi:hypothetical protein [Wielerella bovis]|uniref:hypothetical protein n=1 Tax=Wielerella bovis TaxID=2917790 RepID=UPI00201908F9|nr:hypothetical protein [Wielerella bovis]ULJ61591.1 hypothetical protein MIS46_06135 [Wielerella bovis]ULJ63707.1 hypothetical protein MIS33_05875 [Wielerella bovis]ULJ66116.1 hypothetical protein MIS31_07510 [Wielerella bovis]
MSMLNLLLLFFGMALTNKSLEKSIPYYEINIEVDSKSNLVVRRNNIYYDKDELLSCEKDNGCLVLFNRNSTYCKNIYSLNDDAEIRIRSEWICPKIDSITRLNREYNLYIGNNDGFLSLYTFNLINLLDFYFLNSSDLEKYQKSENYTIVMNDLNIPVGLSPNNIYINFDVSDVVNSIIIKVNKDKRVLSEEYFLTGERRYIRKYYYNNSNEIKYIIELKLNKSKYENIRLIYFHY